MSLFRVVGSPKALYLRQRAVRIDLLLEAAEKRRATGGRGGLRVVGRVKRVGANPGA